MAHATAAAAPIQLDGTEYWMSPLDDKDYEEVNNWIRAQVINMARAMLTDEMSQQERDEILRAAIATARPLNFTNAGENDKVERHGVMVKLIHQGLLARHPGIQYAFVKKALMKPKAIDDVMSRWYELNVSGLKEDTTQETGSPKEEPTVHQTKKSSIKR
jgi:hypothetical protein